jgi:hypothetical protein
MKFLCLKKCIHIWSPESNKLMVKGSGAAEPEGFFRRKMREFSLTAGAETPSTSNLEETPSTSRLEETPSTSHPEIINETTTVVSSRETRLPTDSFICPICSKTVAWETEQDSHVEDCLSRQAIRAMLRESDTTKAVKPSPAESAGKRKSSAATALKNPSVKNPSLCPPSKKLRKLAASNTIESYFKRH